MIKKYVKACFRLLLCLLMLVPLTLEPFTVKAKEASNIAELEEQLAALQRQKTQTQNNKQQTQSEIEAKKNAIGQAYSEIETNRGKIEEAKLKIEESEKEISSKTDETEQLLRFLQIMNGENAYMEYLVGASTPTELVMRATAVEQITEYNKETIEGLEQLITEKEQLQKDLKAREEQLNKNIDSYNDKIASLNERIVDLNEINEDIDSQIKSQKELINYYKSVCPTKTTPLKECVSVAASSGWLRPLQRGVITSKWGYRIHPITGKVNSFHNAVDIGGNAEGTNVYATANGMVSSITVKSSCGGNIVYIHHTVGGKAYTSYYGHLLQVKVKVGDTVTANTVIGTVGGGAGTRYYDHCSTGAHLHYGVTQGWYLGGGKDGYSSWSKLIANNINPPGFPNNGKEGTWFYSRG